jgi:hypothetical protein
MPVSLLALHICKSLSDLDLQFSGIRLTFLYILDKQVLASGVSTTMPSAEGRDSKAFLMSILATDTRELDKF